MRSAALSALAILAASQGCRASFDVELPGQQTATPAPSPEPDWPLTVQAAPGAFEVEWPALPGASQYSVRVFDAGISVAEETTSCSGDPCRLRVGGLDPTGAIPLDVQVVAGSSATALARARTIPSGWNGLPPNRGAGVYKGVDSNGAGETYYGSVMLGPGDVDGDGFDDVLVSGSYYAIPPDSDRGIVTLFLGGADGLPATPSWTVVGPDNNRYLGLSMAAAGNIAGDAANDFYVGMPGAAAAGVVRRYLGQVRGLPVLDPAFNATTGDADEQFGHALALGEFDGQAGLPDLLVAEWLAGAADNGNIWLLPNGTNDEGPATHATGGAGAELGNRLVALGDLDGDGLDEWAAVQSGPTATVYRGLPGMLQSVDYDGVREVAAVGDVNGDGRPDVLFSYTNLDLVQLQLGPSLASARMLEGGATFGDRTCAAGDVNGDGFADVIVMEPGLSTNLGGAHLFYGSNAPEGISATPQYVITGTNAGARLGNCAAAGDIDNDGSGDFVLSDSEARILVRYGPPSRSPVPRVSAALFTTSALTLSVSGVAYDIPSGTSAIECTWDWGDGAAENGPCPGSSQHTYAAPGDYAVRISAVSTALGLAGETVVVRRLP